MPPDKPQRPYYVSPLERSTRYNGLSTVLTVINESSSIGHALKGIDSRIWRCAGCASIAIHLGSIVSPSLWIFELARGTRLLQRLEVANPRHYR